MKRKGLICILLIIVLLLIACPLHAYEEGFVHPYSNNQIGYRTTDTTLEIYWQNIDSQSQSDYAYQYGYPTINSSGGFTRTTPRQYRLLLTGLQPNRTYNENLKISKWNDDFFIINTYFPFKTSVGAATPPTYTGIGGTQVTVNWTKGNNYSNPSYVLYKGPSATGPWTVCYSGTSISAIASGLSAETTYYFFVRSTGLNGDTKDSSVTSVVSGADPAVAAANAAKGAAETAMQAATSAQGYAIQAYDQAALNAINIQEILIKDDHPPMVNVVTVNGATATSSSNINLKVIATDASNSLDYSTDGTTYEILPANGIVNVSLSSGFNEIVVSVRDADGNTASDSIKIWRI